MKIRILFILAVISLCTSQVKAQTGCPMKCWQESFPYYFCDKQGGRHLKCSSDPRSDTMGGLQPVLTHMPGCVNVVPIDSSLDYQPAGPVPYPPYEPTPLDTFRDYFEHTLPSYNGDSDIYKTVLYQWDTDYRCVQAGYAPNDPPNDNSFGGDPDLIADAQYQYDLDTEYYDFFEKGVHIYDSEMAYYDSAIISYNNGTDVPYQQIWNNTQANQDAQEALNGWLALCNIQGDPRCCIQIEPDNNLDDWPGNYDPTKGQRQFAVGKTPALGDYCSDGNSCPDTSWRKILYNATNNFLYQQTDNLPHPDPSYILHPFSPFEGWFTGDTAPSGPALLPEYKNKDFSFKWNMEHEIGHFLGLSHPEETAGGDTCPNNATKCHIPMLMEQGMIQPGIDPEPLTSDDACEFQKLYCPGTGEDDVAEINRMSLGATVFPNPTTGLTLLQYRLSDGSFVIITIYDMLGKLVKPVFSGYEEMGVQSISLGTEALPAGQYICRITIGNQVTNLNFVVQK